MSYQCPYDGKTITPEICLSRQTKRDKGDSKAHCYGALCWYFVCNVFINPRMRLGEICRRDLSLDGEMERKVLSPAILDLLESSENLCGERQWVEWYHAPSTMFKLTLTPTYDPCRENVIDSSDNRQVNRRNVVSVTAEILARILKALQYIGIARTE